MVYQRCFRYKAWLWWKHWISTKWRKMCFGSLIHCFHKWNEPFHEPAFWKLFQSVTKSWRHHRVSMLTLCPILLNAVSSAIFQQNHLIPFVVKCFSTFCNFHLDCPRNWIGTHTAGMWNSLPIQVFCSSPFYSTIGKAGKYAAALFVWMQLLSFVGLNTCSNRYTKYSKLKFVPTKVISWQTSKYWTTGHGLGYDAQFVSKRWTHFVDWLPMVSNRVETTEGRSWDGWKLRYSQLLPPRNRKHLTGHLKAACCQWGCS